MESNADGGGRLRVPGAWTVGALCWLIGGVGVPVLLLSTVADGVKVVGIQAVLLFLIALYSSARLCYLIARGEPRIASGVFWLFVYVCLGVAPLCQVHTGLFPNLADRNSLSEAAAIILVGCVAFDVAGLLARDRKTIVDIDRARLLSPGRVKWLGIIGLLGSAYYAQHVGLASLFSSRATVTQAFFAGGYGSGAADSSKVGSSLAVGLGTAPILVAWVAWTAVIRREKRNTAAAWLWWATLAAGNLVVNNPISSARFWFLAVAVAIFFVFPQRNKNRFRAAMIVGVLAALVLFPYSDYYRTDPSLRGPLQTNSIPVELSIKDYDQMVMTGNTVWWVGNHGYTDGSQLLSDVLFFVPHSIWPGRARDTGTVLGLDLPSAEVNVNLSSPLWVELWIDFGWPGLILGFLGLGFLLRRWEDLFVRLNAIGNRGAALLDVAIPVIVGYEFILLRGPLLQATGRFAILCASLWFVRAAAAGAVQPLVERHRRRRDEGPSAAAALSTQGEEGAPLGVGGLVLIPGSGPADVTR